MRTLRVLGLAEDGESLVCGDQHSGELFAIPTDDRLRAGARGDLSRLGQLEIEMEPQLRPREIQSRIRAGASIEEVAAAACTSIGRIERYAYPVLLERSTMAEKARYACGVIDGNPTKRSLDELVTAALAVRGQAAGVMWDAYRDEDGWLLALRWQAGRSENRAHWAIQAGPRTTTLRPKDDAAREILDPSPRTLREIHETKNSAPPFPTFESSSEESTGAKPPQSAPAADAEMAERPNPAAGSHHPAGSRRIADRLEQDQHVEPADHQGASSSKPKERPVEVARTGTESQSSRNHRRGQRPVMPGWEDVLLGGGPTPSL